MSNFSGAVKLQDLSDFIAPSQACVVKLDGSKKLDLQADAFGEAGSVALQQPQAPKQAASGKGFSQTRLDADTSAVKVTLQDCLACSGCVTSAETVLLEHQSVGELRSKLKEEGTTVIVSVSPQSRASLAQATGLSPEAVLRRLTTFFSRLGVAHVFDTTASRDFSLIETAAEFVHRYRLAHPDLAEAGDAPGADTQTNGATPSDRAGAAASGNGPASERLPMLASACPGWVCYAEKTQPAVLPHISTAKSPQAVMGTLVKRIKCQQLGLDPGRVYHTAVMPCYDKKLEASRSDFDLPGSGVPEVDSVLTTGEVAELLQQEGAEPAALPEAPLQQVAALGEEDGRLRGYPGGAGGYLEHIFRTAARQLFGREVPPGPLPLKALRNADFKEVSLEVDGRTVLRFAAVYGFRNIQTLVRKIKMKRCEYDYVEVMACPSGCLNGGGQLRPSPGQTQQQLLAELDDAYHSANILLRQPQDNPQVQQLYAERLGGRPYSPAAQQLLHTGYQRRDKLTTTAMVGDW